MMPRMHTPRPLPLHLHVLDHIKISTLPMPTQMQHLKKKKNKNNCECTGTDVDHRFKDNHDVSNKLTSYKNVSTDESTTIADLSNIESDADACNECEDKSLNWHSK